MENWLGGWNYPGSIIRLPLAACMRCLRIMATESCSALSRGSRPEAAATATLFVESAPEAGPSVTRLAYRSLLYGSLADSSSPAGDVVVPGIYVRGWNCR